MSQFWEDQIAMAAASIDFPVLMPLRTISSRGALFFLLEYFSSAPGDIPRLSATAGDVARSPNGRPSTIRQIARCKGVAVVRPKPSSAVTRSSREVKVL